MTVSFLPPSPSLEDVADALAMAVMNGVLLRSGVAGRRMPLEEAFQTSRRYLDDVARSARALTTDPGLSAGSPEQNGERLRVATRWMAATVTGLIGRRESIEGALTSAGRLRERLWPLARSIADEPNADATATLIGGALQGLIAAGNEPAAALSSVQTRRQALTVAANGLVRTDGDATEATLATASLYATALAGLIGRGQSVGDAMVDVRQQRDVLMAQGARLVETPPSASTAPSLATWRAARSDESAALAGPNTPRP